MKITGFTLFLLVFCHFSVAQNHFLVTAEKGDGIYSILRKNGLDPTEYYGSFVSLNESKIKNGNELYHGTDYRLPTIQKDYGVLAADFDAYQDRHTERRAERVSNISPKNDKLKNAVVFLIPSKPNAGDSDQVRVIKNQIYYGLAEELMLKGCQVHLLGLEGLKGEKELLDAGNAKIDGEGCIAQNEYLDSYVDKINLTSLKNKGRYQRVLVINVNKAVEESDYYDCSIYHHDRGDEGGLFAKTLLDIFNDNSMVGNKKDVIEVFSNQKNLFLAKNILPPITMIDIGYRGSNRIEERVSLDRRENALVSMIADGVLLNYTNPTLEND